MFTEQRSVTSQSMCILSAVYADFWLHLNTKWIESKREKDPFLLQSHGSIAHFHDMQTHTAQPRFSTSVGEHLKKF